MKRIPSLLLFLAEDVLARHTSSGKAFIISIDLLIVRKDQVINLCEMKYSETGYIVKADFNRDQKRKISDFRKITGTKYAIYSTLITTYEIEQNPYTGELQAIITAENLFQ